MTIAEIQRLVAAHYGLRIEDMTSSRRAACIVLPRWVAMYLARQSGKTFPQIARAFQRDNSTVQYGVRNVVGMIRADPDFARRVAAIIPESPT